MNDVTGMMTIEEALSCIKLHFVEEEGLIAQIERGLPIDIVQVKRLEMALQRLHIAWENSESVLKQEVRLLWNVIPRLEHALLFYPEEAELTKFMREVIVWLDELFMTEVMSEEHAIAVVSQHVIGPSFLKGILLCEKIDSTSAYDVFTAVETLARVWKSRKHIPKLAAGALISTQSTIIPNCYSEAEKQQIQKIMEQLRERITQCWE